jgi:hypothetical protein
VPLVFKQLPPIKKRYENRTRIRYDFALVYPHPGRPRQTRAGSNRRADINLTRDLVTRLGVPLADLNDVRELDLTIDGTDEIDANGRMIKGGAANLVWEKSSPMYP